MSQLLLADLKDLSDEELRAHIAVAYETEEHAIYDILLAYEHVGSWGCDSESFMLLRNRATGALYENRAGHCSCYGFEGQFSPEATTLDYLKSDKFYVNTGGYDDDAGVHREAIRRYIAEL